VQERELTPMEKAQAAVQQQQTQAQQQTQQQKWAWGTSPNPAPSSAGGIKMHMPARRAPVVTAAWNQTAPAVASAPAAAAPPSAAAADSGTLLQREARPIHLFKQGLTWVRVLRSSSGGGGRGSVATKAAGLRRTSICAVRQGDTQVMH
jgi:hypothetical protein